MCLFDEVVQVDPVVGALFGKQSDGHGPERVSADVGDAFWRHLSYELFFLVELLQSAWSWWVVVVIVPSELAESLAENAESAVSDRWWYVVSVLEASSVDVA